MIPDALIIGLRADGPLLHNIWSKLDLIVPYDWENDRVPATVEVELGKMSTSFFGLYVSGLTGIGGDRKIDWGASLNARFIC